MFASVVLFLIPFHNNLHYDFHFLLCYFLSCIFWDFVTVYYVMSKEVDFFATKAFMHSVKFVKYQ